MADFRHGQPAKIVDTKQVHDAVHINKYGRLYESTIFGYPAYIWIIGTALQLPIEGPSAVIVEVVSEAEILRNQPQHR